MAGHYLRYLVLSVFKGLDFVSVHKNAQKELAQYPEILIARMVDNS